MAPVIELCRTCGFDVPADAHRCPACAGRPAPTRAARQVAGLALPTRSVRALPGTRPVPPVRPLGRARAARSAFSFTTALALITFATAGLTWLSTQPSIVLQVPSGTTELLDHVTTISATASVVAFVLGLVAMAEWTVRAALRSLRSHGRRHVV
jgi:hypothetical protein